jgi:cytochrome c-type biogenesis protein CcmH/NrfF
MSVRTGRPPHGAWTSVVAVLVAVLIAVLVTVAPGTAIAASLPDIEDEVMCPTCNMPLNTAQSPQADEQRQFIRELIAEGRDKEQIKAALVAEYGQNVLADPNDDGFGIAAYVVPFLLVGALAVGLLVVIPRRRRRTPAMAADPAATPSISAADAARLDADLARYDP